MELLHTHTPTPTPTPTHQHPLTHPHTHTRTRTRTHTDTYTHAPAHAPARAHTHTDTHKLTNTQTHTLGTTKHEQSKKSGYVCTCVQLVCSSLRRRQQADKQQTTSDWCSDAATAWVYFELSFSIGEHLGVTSHCHCRLLPQASCCTKGAVTQQSLVTQHSPTNQ